MWKSIVHDFTCWLNPEYQSIRLKSYEPEQECLKVHLAQVKLFQNIEIVGWHENPFPVGWFSYSHLHYIDFEKL